MIYRERPRGRAGGRAEGLAPNFVRADFKPARLIPNEAGAQFSSFSHLRESSDCLSDRPLRRGAVRAGGGSGQMSQREREGVATLDKNLHFRDHIERVRNTAFFYKARLRAMLGRKSKLSRRNKRTVYKMCIRTVMTYASPVFAHAAPKALHRLQGLRTPTISKYMKDASKRFFDIAGSHPNALRAAVDYQPPHPTLSVGHETYLPIHLTLLQRQLANDVNDTHD
ncbi:hypothetical protein EVAR_10035_1 [Eumeta japonica]|uniref:RNA-directed DNA polymerase from mobile element jockey n=1 Tax=Eumeta variegata TaxID=151549 RepID=A0A4C1TR55_EUMVA|nr:hypothetical protein EVAR_10035_1 [Eumeta japonica]